MDKQPVPAPKKRWVLFLPLVLCLLFGITIYFSLFHDPYEHGSTLENRPLPSFLAEDLFESTNTLTEQDINGDIVLLNVWASWCAVCKAEHRFLLQLAEVPGIALYGLNYRDSRQQALTVLQESGNPYKKVIFDPEGKLALELGVYGTPETFLIDGQGVIRLRYSGELNEERWQGLFVPNIAAIQKNVGEP